jgi:ankyrin repeat domain-containing protein 50
MTYIHMSPVQRACNHLLTFLAGCGKTILRYSFIHPRHHLTAHVLTYSSSTVIDNIEAYCHLNSDPAVAYFYFDFNDPEKQNATNCLSSLIAQLCSQVVDLPKKLKDLYSRCNEGKHKAGMPALIAILKAFALAEEPHDIFIIADALDECPKNGEQELRSELLDLITEISSWSPSNIHLLVTSRQEPDIKERLMPLLTTPAISVEGSEADADIKKYIENQLSTDPKLKGWSDDVKERIKHTLVKRAKGM